MPDLPFDSVSLMREGRIVHLSAKEFLAMPMDARVHAILQRTITFYSHGKVLDRSLALKQLRFSGL